MTPIAVTLIAGDGIGAEVLAAAVRVLEATGVQFRWERAEAGAEVASKCGSTLPEATVASLSATRLCLKGPTATPSGGGHQSVNVALRKRFDLYAGVRPVKSVPGVKSRYEGVDLVVIRENTEDLYAGLEHEVVPGVVESLKIITERASTRIARFAFDYARRNGRRRVTSVHKANIMKLSDGLFLRCARAVARDHPEIAYDEVIVDALCEKLVIDPTRFDMLLLENLYGDILSDLCAGLIGGLGVAPGANFGDDAAVFEAVHGTAPDIAGSGRANPVAMILSGAMLLDHAGHAAEAARVRRAVEEVLVDGAVRTPDLGGTATTMQFAEAVASHIGGTR